MNIYKWVIPENENEDKANFEKNIIYLNSSCPMKQYFISWTYIKNFI